MPFYSPITFTDYTSVNAKRYKIPSNLNYNPEFSLLAGFLALFPVSWMFVQQVPELEDQHILS